MTLEELKCRLEYKVGTEKNMTEIQLPERGSEIEAFYYNYGVVRAVSSELPLGLELIVSLIRVESGPDLSLSHRCPPTQETGRWTGNGARLVITLSSSPGFL